MCDGQCNTCCIKVLQFLLLIVTSYFYCMSARVRKMTVRFCIGIVCLFLTVETAVICPTKVNYSPCDCYEYSSNTIWINCRGQNLTNSRVSGILNVFLTSPGVSPVGKLSLQNNKLTRVPNQIKLFPQLVEVWLSDNKITSIQSGAFNFTTTTVEWLVLSDNPVATIAPGAFQGMNTNNKTITVIHRHI